ncbi:phage minor tail protein L [Ralstonia pseudosolanacearum]|uniref:phage minor tail protein L n=1 Tax=Ralstonia pseudosolanacearum TaxID=1310165 RepID=UPI001FF78C94|nr:phage minor tail protein L [Ralstonia pseudosolanacearum]
MKITADIQRLEPGALIDLFELDATAVGGDVRRFHGYGQVGSIWWAGNEYGPWPVEATGFERTGQGQQPAPRLAVGNVDGSISALCLYTDDLVGATVRRRRTLGRFLDARNFPEGNPEADPAEELPAEVWFVEQKTSETNETVEFELSSALDFNGVQLPRRQIIASVCGWLMVDGYRGAQCGYTGAAMFDRDDNPVSDPSLDRCGGRLSSCKCRFGENEPLPFGGFPAADLIRT